MRMYFVPTRNEAYNRTHGTYEPVNQLDLVEYQLVAVFINIDQLKYTSNHFWRNKVALIGLFITIRILNLLEIKSKGCGY